MLIKNKIVVFVSLLTILCAGQAIAQEDVNKALYNNLRFVQEASPKTDCSLNGAWTAEYTSYWLVDPSNLKSKLPSYVKSINYQGVVRETSFYSISTPEDLSSQNLRNKYYLTSSLSGESAHIEIDLENNTEYVNWIPLNLYIDPFVVADPKQQLRIELSYAHTVTGHLVYIQDTNFQAGCYLKVFVKSPLPGAQGTVNIELKSSSNSRPAISGIFWGELIQESEMNVMYSRRDQIRAQKWNRDLAEDAGISIWSPETESDIDIQVTVGESEYITSTGNEFPTSVRTKDVYNFKALQGLSGPKGLNGLEFYLKTKNSELCSQGCELGLYFAEGYQQNIAIYSAEEGKRNKLLERVKTIGNNVPSFDVFQVEPNEKVSLRIRLTTENEETIPTLRGLYIKPRSGETIDFADDEVILEIEDVPQGTTLGGRDDSFNDVEVSVSTSSGKPIRPTLPVSVNDLGKEKKEDKRDKENKDKDQGEEDKEDIEEVEIEEVEIEEESVTREDLEEETETEEEIIEEIIEEETETEEEIIEETIEEETETEEEIIEETIEEETETEEEIVEEKTDHVNDLISEPVEDRYEEKKEELQEKHEEKKAEMIEKFEEIKEKMEEKKQELQEKHEEKKAEMIEKFEEMKEKWEEKKEELQEKHEEIKEKMEEAKEKAEERQEAHEEVREEIQETIQEIREDVQEAIQDILKASSGSKPNNGRPNAWGQSNLGNIGQAIQNNL